MIVFLLITYLFIMLSALVIIHTRNVDNTCLSTFCETLNMPIVYKKSSAANRQNRVIKTIATDDTGYLGR